MKDEILDWIEDHRKLLIILIVVLLLVVVMFAIRHHNLSKKAEQQEQQQVEQQVIDTPTQEPDTIPEPSYQSSLNNRTEDKKNNSKVEKNTEEETVPEITPNFDVTCKVFGHTKVPNKNMDGSSCKNYLSRVKLADFGTFWGTPLDVNDMQSTTKYLVGVDQDDIEEEIADLQSVGWLISNFDNLGEHDAVKFTNLHVIGSLSDTHVAVLCSYDWYSAFGLKDTLVVFEDISGTLSVEDFDDGAIFSATVFVHNMKVIKVNGQNVVCVQYNVFK